MARYRKRRKRFRRRRRRGGFNKKVKRIVKKEFKKKIEMKYATGSVPLFAVSNTGTLSEHFPVAGILQGVALNQRIGNKINLHKWLINFSFVGPIGLSQTPLRMRVMIVYSKRTVVNLDFPQNPDLFMDLETMKRNGIYVISDKIMTLAPQFSTVVTIPPADPQAMVYVKWCASHPATRSSRRKINLRGRTRNYDAAIEITNGRLWVYAVSEINASAETCRMGMESRLFYTDA